MYYGLIDHVSRAEQKIMCPFHEDRNPSMLVDLAKGNYFCFGCEASGDALKFVRTANPKLDELQSCMLFAKILNSKEVRKLKVRAKSRVKKEKKQSLVEAYDYYHGLSKVIWDSHSFENDIVSKEVERCRSYMEERGFDTGILNRCGAKITYNPYYPIIFPIMDNGEFKGWVSRTTNRRVERRRKYLYNEGFSKSTTLAGDYSGTKGTVVLCEGYMDMLKFKMLGYEKVAATLGWHISDEQVLKLKSEGVRCVISAMDNDKYGKKGTEYLKQFFDVVRFQYLKGVKDPGDMDQSTFDKMDRKTKEVYKEYKYGRDGRDKTGGQKKRKER